MAYRVLAARCDPHEPLSPEHAVEYALNGFSNTSQGAQARSEVSKAVARAFSESRPLDNILDGEGTIPTKSIEREIKIFLADELRRIAKARAVPVGQLCDVTDRALRSWVSAAYPKYSS